MSAPSIKLKAGAACEGAEIRKEYKTLCQRHNDFYGPDTGHAKKKKKSEARFISGLPKAST